MLKKGLYMLLGASLFGMGLLFTNFGNIGAQVQYGDRNNVVFDCLELNTSLVRSDSIQCYGSMVFYGPKGKAGGYVQISHNGIQVIPSSDNPNGITIRVPKDPAPKGAVTHIDAGGIFVGKIETEEEVWKRYFRDELVETSYSIGGVNPDAFAALYVGSDDLKPRVLINESDSVATLSAKDSVDRRIVEGDNVVKNAEERLPKKIFDERSKLEPVKPIQDRSDLDRIFKPKEEKK